ncbi:MAG: CocE/NonD family hydrolase [Fimbriimonadaceae bacterium]|nr:CocE/NonD family hydrolase [Fimbriimonadaceae bacterium]
MAVTRAGSVPSYEVVVQSNRPLPLRDGLRLATDLYFPARDGQVLDGPWPVVFLRTPYDKLGHGASGRFYAERGYVAAIQDVRGRYASPGEFYAFAHEGPDGYDSVEWLAAQPWCNGRVGTFGQSYEAAVQSALAALHPPHLAAMIPTFGPSSYYHSSMRQNGALELRFFVYAFGMLASSREAAADANLKAAADRANADIWDWVRAAPIRAGASPLAAVPSYERWCLDLQRHVCYDDYWRLPGYGPRPYYDQHAAVPTLYVGGWYDTYTRSTCENYIALSQRQSAPVHLLLGPWHHGGVGQPTAGDLDFRPEGGLPSYEAVRLRWFDQFLKGLETGLLAEPPVRYFVMGGGAGMQAESRTIRHGGRWQTASQWPPAEVVPTPWYCHADGTLATEPPTNAAAPTVWQFDPANPVPTIGGQLSAIPIPPGGFDQRQDSRFPFTTGRLPLAARDDVIVFQTPPLEADLEIVGPLRVRLWVSTDGLDTDFTAKLIDVYPPGPHYPDGCALLLGDSIQRLRFRNGYEREELATPGEVYELNFELYPTANRFTAGHRLRLDISSSNYPRFDVNPNTGGPLDGDRRRRVATNTLYHDPARPSQIILPVRPPVAR